MFLNGKFGAGDTVFNLNNGLIVDSAVIETGAGNLYITIDADSVPASMNLKVNSQTVKSGLGAKSSLRSDNWNSALVRVTLQAKVGVGQLILETK